MGSEIPVGTVAVGPEAIPFLTDLVAAMREGRDGDFNQEAVEWAEFLIDCLK